jgi:hypothetical protein
MTADDRRISRRALLQTGAAGVAGGLLLRPFPASAGQPGGAGLDTVSRVYHALNGSPAQNVARVIELAYGGIQGLVGQSDVVLVRPSLQWKRNGYTNTSIGKALIDLILKRPGGFSGEIIVVEDVHRENPAIGDDSGWSTWAKDSNGPWNWFELIQYYVDHAGDYPGGIHTDPVTGQINVSFQFLMNSYDVTLDNPHPILSTYGGKRYLGSLQWVDGTVHPFRRFAEAVGANPHLSCVYFYRSDLRYTNTIARVAPLRTEYNMSYPVFKSQHSGLYISYYKEHVTAWDPVADNSTAFPVKLVNMCTLNHHGNYAGATSAVKSHFGMEAQPFHDTGWANESGPATFYYAGGAIGYWLHAIRRADLHMSCAEYVGRETRWENEAFQAKSVAISTDPVALDYYVGKNILFPAGGPYGMGGQDAAQPWSNDPTLATGYYHLTLEHCRDPLKDHSIINGTLSEDEMAVYLHDFARTPGDVNGDGVVDLKDLNLVRNARGTSTGRNPRADLTLDGRIDMADMVSVRSRLSGVNP